MCPPSRFHRACVPPRSLFHYTPSGPATLHGLPPEVAARQAGRTAALAPPQDTWLVAAVPPPPAPHASSDQLQETGRQAGLSAWRGHEELLLVDVGRKGAVLSVEQARAKYRDMLVGVV